MRRTALPLLALLLAACAPDKPVPEVAAQLEKFDSYSASVRVQLNAGKLPGAVSEQDFRGRTYQDDLGQWAWSPRIDQEISALRKRAAAARTSAAAELPLNEARVLINEAVHRGSTVWNYWAGQLPAPYWRHYWQAFFKSNGVAEDPPDPLLLSIEQRMKRALDAGDFKTASKESELMVGALDEALNTASRRVLSSRRADLKFTPRKSDCVPGAPLDPWREKPKLIHAESVETFYPPEAIKRGEQGAVALRVQIDRKGCATAVAVLLHSGVEVLDAAALKWFESAQFSPASQHGQPIESELAFKVRFTLKD